MIELTEQQVRALEAHEGGPPRLQHPQTKALFVLLSADEYQRLIEGYDDRPWTREELETLAWNAGQQAGWDGMDEYDDIPEKP